jgi:hypothetical protein
MIGGSGHYPQTLGMETSSHGHGGSIREDFVSLTLKVEGEGLSERGFGGEAPFPVE